MTGKELLRLERELETFWRGFDRFFRRQENRAHVRCFARGQMGTVERKSLEPLADAEEVAPRALQAFFSEGCWDEEGLRDEFQRRVGAEHGGEDGIFIVDETSDAKKGERTAGVAPQYCGATGKVDNCIVTVHLAYARGAFHALIDGELFLPACWNANLADPVVQEKRRRAGIPDGVGHVPKTELALRLLARARRNGVPGRWVAADAGYGRSPGWRQELGALGLQYVVEVPCNVQGWLRRPRRLRHPAGRGQRGPAPHARSVDPGRTVAALLPQTRGWCTAWVRFRVHNTQKGPEVWECRLARFWEQGVHAAAAPLKLLVARNVRTGEVKYFLSNAPDDQPLERLVKVAFSRWRIERCFQDAKSELGLDHAELRKYRGLQRHLTLTEMNLYFLRCWQLAHGGGEKGAQSRASGRRHTDPGPAHVARLPDAAPRTALGGAPGAADAAHPGAQQARASGGDQETAARVAGRGDQAF